MPYIEKHDRERLVGDYPLSQAEAVVSEFLGTAVSPSA